MLRSRVKWRVGVLERLAPVRGPGAKPLPGPPGVATSHGGSAL